MPFGAPSVGPHQKPWHAYDAFSNLVYIVIYVHIVNMRSRDM